MSESAKLGCQIENRAANKKNRFINMRSLRQDTFGLTRFDVVVKELVRMAKRRPRKDVVSERTAKNLPKVSH